MSPMDKQQFYQVLIGLKGCHASDSGRTRRGHRIREVLPFSAFFQCRKEGDSNSNLSQSCAKAEEEQMMHMRFYTCANTLG